MEDVDDGAGALLRSFGIDMGGGEGGMGEADKVKKSDVDAVVKAALAAASQEKRKTEAREKEREARKEAETAVSSIDKFSIQSAADAASSALALDAAGDLVGAIVQFTRAVDVVADALHEAGVTSRAAQSSQQVQSILRAVEGYIVRSRELRVKICSSGRKQKGQMVDLSAESRKKSLERLARAGYKSLSAGLSIRKQALEMDNAGSVSAAYVLYNESLDNFIATMRAFPEKVTKTLNKVVMQTLDRAEALKRTLFPETTTVKDHKEGNAKANAPSSSAAAAAALPPKAPPAHNNAEKQKKASSAQAATPTSSSTFASTLTQAGITDAAIRTLLDNGIADAETLALLEPNDMKELGLKMGDSLKVRKLVRALSAQ